MQYSIHPLSLFIYCCTLSSTVAPQILSSSLSLLSTLNMFFLFLAQNLLSDLLYSSKVFSLAFFPTLLSQTP